MARLQNFIKYIGGRKMFMFLLMLTISVGFFVAPMFYDGATKVTFKEWQDFAIYLTGIIAVGNIGEHAASAYKDKK